MDRQAAERRRRQRYKSIQLLLNVLILTAILTLASLTAYLNDRIGELMRRTTGDIKTVQTRVDAASAASSDNKQDLEEINRTLSRDQELLNRAIAESRATALIDWVGSYLNQLEAQGKLHIDSPDERNDVAGSLRVQIRSIIVNEMIARPEVSDTQVRRRIERLVDTSLPEDR